MIIFNCHPAFCASILLLFVNLLCVLQLGLFITFHRAPQFSSWAAFSCSASPGSGRFLYVLVRSFRCPSSSMFAPVTTVFSSFLSIASCFESRNDHLFFCVWVLRATKTQQCPFNIPSWIIFLLLNFYFTSAKSILSILYLEMNPEEDEMVFEALLWLSA